MKMAFVRKILTSRASSAFNLKSNRAKAKMVTTSNDEVQRVHLRAEAAEGVATVMAIGTANPPNCVYQSTFPDYYFGITNNDHMKELKQKFHNICGDRGVVYTNYDGSTHVIMHVKENSTFPQHIHAKCLLVMQCTPSKQGDKSMIKKRYMYLTEEMLKENPRMCEFMAPTLDTRQDMALVEVPELGKEAATRAIKEWGQPKSKITHLIFCASTGVEMPGADYHLANLLGLNPSVKRLMIYMQGCFVGAAALRLAKDMAENNKGARVLIVCSEIFTTLLFRGPSDDFKSLVAQALLGDGASAVIVGAEPVPGLENKPLFEIVSTAQTILPGSAGTIKAQLREVGLLIHLLKEIPGLISKNIGNSLVEAFQPLGITDWNSIFWVAHPGGPAILDQVEFKLGLTPEKLRASRHVLSEYGNMSAACVFFILDEMRKRSAEDGLKTTGEGLEWGVLFGFGPGITVDTVVLHSMST